MQHVQIPASSDFRRAAALALRHYFPDASDAKVNKCVKWLAQHLIGHGLSVDVHKLAGGWLKVRGSLQFFQLNASPITGLRSLEFNEHLITANGKNLWSPQTR